MDSTHIADAQPLRRKSSKSYGHDVVVVTSPTPGESLLTFSIGVTLNTDPEEFTILRRAG